MNPLRVGVIGTGAISGIYLQNLQAYSGTTVVALADLDPARAQAKAAEHGVAKVTDVEGLLADPEVDLVLNLTIPAAHYQVARQAIEAKKHVYNEKPLAVAQQEGRDLLDLASRKGVRVGCAPDTVLGAGTQTARDLIEQGAIGQVVGFNAFMMGGGVETWHPNPPFYYQIGGGPLFDMGPYYMSALVTLLGPVTRVAGLTRITFPTRHITSQPLAGTTVTVETPTHIVSALEFASGVIGQLTTSFDTMVPTPKPNIEIYGSEGTLLVPDPNTFGGPVKIWRKGASDWEEITLARPYPENHRGLGVLDMAHAIQENRPHRASGDLAQHCLEVMHGAHIAATEGTYVQLDAPDGVQPAPMPVQAW